MSEQLQVTGTIDTQVLVITLSYGPELSDRMITEYEKLVKEVSNKPLAVQIHADKASSPLVRAC